MTEHTNRHGEPLHVLTLRMPQDLHDRLVDRAREEDRTLSQVLRLAARLYLQSSA